MKESDLKPASSLAQRFGVKALVYGPPGTGKTPLIKTSPRPVLCVVEPGMMSMKDATNIPAWEAYTGDKISEFFDWVFRSAEAKNFDTVGIDSLSQMAEIILKEELKRNKDGRKAYGEMSRRMMEICDGLYFQQNKHVYMICKEDKLNDNGSILRRPYFPGQDLNVKIPHLYDQMLHIGKKQIPGVAGTVLAIQTDATFDIMARDRSGKLDLYEQPNLANLFNKCMS